MPKLKHNPLFILWHVLRNDIHQLEYDPQTQYRYHIAMTRYWALNFPIIIALFFFLPKLWIAIALFINTIYSLYANLATDFGAVPASYAAWKADEIKQRQETNSDIVRHKPSDDSPLVNEQSHYSAPNGRENAGILREMAEFDA